MELNNNIYGACNFEADYYFYDNEGIYRFDGSKIHLAHKWCYEQVEKSMQFPQYQNIILSNTSTTEKEIQPYIELAEKYGYKVISLIVENRHGNSNVHSVPEEKLKQMEERLRNNIKLI